MSDSDKTYSGSVERSAVNQANSSAESLFKRILRKIFPDQRKHARISGPELEGYLGRVRASRAFEIGDVSLGGFRVVTSERWEPGTEMPITLRRTNVAPDQDEDCFTVQATAVRWSDDCVAFSVLLSEEESVAVYDNPLHARWASEQEMQHFLERVKNPDGSEPALAGAEVATSGGADLKAAFDGARPVWTHGAGD
jgi:hypothetical protein